MRTLTWLDYFESNARPDQTLAGSLAREIATPLHGALSVSLGRFQLGESAGGRIHAEVATHRDPVLDGPTRRAVQLYIEEEWRHGRELATVIGVLGGVLQRAHWTNSAFTACRRLLGLRTKMLTLAIAEVIGIAYYRALARGVGSASLSAVLTRIADEEGRHLDFQAAFFERCIATTPRGLRGPYRALLRAQTYAVLLAALLVLSWDHGALLRRVGASVAPLWRAAWRELVLRRFLSGSALAARSAARYVLAHER